MSHCNHMCDGNVALQQVVVEKKKKEKKWREKKNNHMHDGNVVLQHAMVEEKKKKDKWKVGRCLRFKARWRWKIISILLNF